MQYVSKEPSSRLEVVTIQQELEQQLMQRQARETGICSVREDLYRQLFGARPAARRSLRHDALIPPLCALQMS